jgi:5-methylcytosine-specific restriction endonuclease McrA
MGHATSIETRKKISDAHKGRKFTPERCEAMSKLRKGKKTIPCSPEKRLKLHETHILRREKHWNWKGGVYDEFKNIRCSVEYRLWKSAVFEKDGHECQWCGAKEYLEADHIQTFAEHPELRFAIDNGRVLCMDCHAKRHPEYADLILGRKGFMKRSSNNSLEIT